MSYFKLLDLHKSGAAAYEGPITLDMLWDSAAQLGKVKVDHSLSSGQYVEIGFNRVTGSLVWARGSHSDIREAFRLAIAEALAMGARP